MLHVDSAFAWSTPELPMWMYTAFPLRVISQGDLDKGTCSGRGFKRLVLDPFRSPA